MRMLSCLKAHANITSDLVIQFDKMAVNLCTSRNCMKIGHGSNLGIQGFRDLGIEGILSIIIDRA